MFIALGKSNGCLKYFRPSRPAMSFGGLKVEHRQGIECLGKPDGKEGIVIVLIVAEQQVRPRGTPMTSRHGDPVGARLGQFYAALTDEPRPAGIAADPDNPEWTAQDFHRAKPFATVFPGMAGGRRGLTPARAASGRA